MVDGNVARDAEGSEAAEWERDRQMNIWQRVNAVMVEVGGHIEKDAHVSIGREGYDYISHDAVTEHIRAACVMHGIAVLPSVADHQKDTNRTELTVDVAFINIDKPDDFITVRSVGYGVDNSDKGPGKAWSYAVKYAYLKLFMLNSADDIEADDTEHERPVSAKEIEEKREAERRVSEADHKALSNLKAAIEGADSIEAVDALMKENKRLLGDVPDVTSAFFTELAANTKREMEEGG